MLVSSSIVAREHVYTVFTLSVDVVVVFTPPPVHVFALLVYVHIVETCVHIAKTCGVQN